MGDAPPEASGRPVRVYDFEEPRNPDPVPERWFRAQDDASAAVRRPGFPAFNQAEFDASRAFSGRRSVRLPTRGGSTSLRLMAGDAPVFPDADYRVDVMVSTTDLQHARARVTARLLNQQLEAIPGSESSGPPMVSPGAWTRTQVTVPGRFADAAWLQIDLEVLQPRQLLPGPDEGPTAAFRVWREDVEGGAWFDDVTVTLLPRTRFEPVPASGVVVGEAEVALSLQVRDLGGRELTGVVRVLDVNDRVVWSTRVEVDPGNRPMTLRPEIGSYGWFRCRLSVSSDGEAVSEHEVWVVRLPSSGGAGGGGGVSEDRSRLGIHADGLPEAALPALADLADAVGAGFVVIPAADPAVDAPGARAAMEARSEALEALLAGGREVTLCVAGVPSRLAVENLVDPGDVLAFAEKDRTGAALLSLLEPTLDVFGQRVLRYQAGRLSGVVSAGGGAGTGLKRDVSAGVSGLERAIARLAPGPMIALPWRADVAPPRAGRVGLEGESGARASSIAPGPVVDALSVGVPPGLGAEGLDGLAARVAALPEPPSELTIVPELADLSRFGAWARSVEAARRGVEFWRVFSPAPGGGEGMRVKLGLDHPFSVAPRPGVEAPALRPKPEVAVLAGVAARLAGRRIIGPVPAPPGVRALLFAGPAGAGTGGGALGRGVVAAWNEAAEPGEAFVEVMQAGDDLAAFDCFGNPLPGPGSPGVQGMTRVPVGESPVFIENVDPYLAMFSSSLRIEPTFVPAVVSEHEARVLIANPWPIRITGRVQIKQSEGEGAGPRRGDWSITPNFVEFAVAPGETAEIPVTMSFGPGQLAGGKDLWVVARVLADRTYPPVRVRTSLEVGLPDLELSPEVSLGPGLDGPDVIVTAAVTNKDTRARVLRLDTATRAAPAQQAQISDLPPGQTVLKRFVFRGMARTMSGQRIVVSLSDAEGAARLNRAVVVP
jgi:hypothetical protein